MRVGAHDYKIDRLSAVDGFHVARKMAPVLTWLAAGMMSGDDAPKSPQEYAKAMLALMVNMSREDADFALFTCLARIHRMQGVMAAPLIANGQVMFADMEMLEMVELMWRVIDASKLLDPFVSPLSGSAPPAP